MRKRHPTACKHPARRGNYYRRESWRLDSLRHYLRKKRTIGLSFFPPWQLWKLCWTKRLSQAVLPIPTFASRSSSPLPPPLSCKEEAFVWRFFFKSAPIRVITKSLDMLFTRTELTFHTSISLSHRSACFSCDFLFCTAVLESKGSNLPCGSCC